MTREQLYEKIEAYLEQGMSQAERASFERELAADQELQRELGLHRRLHQELAKAGKARLRKQLQEVAAEFPVESPPKGGTLGKWFLGLALVGLVAGLAWWISQGRGGQEAVSEAPVQQQDSLNRQIQPADTTIMAPPPESLPEEVDKTTAPSVPTQPVANAFTPNARLEALLGSKPGDGQFNITAEAGTTQRPDGRYELVIAGLLRTPELPENTRLFIRVYNNRAAGFPAGQAMEESPLKLDAVEEGEDIYAFGKLKNFTFRYTLKNRLRSGLYYYLIVNDGAVAPLFAGKTTLGEPQE